MSSEPVEVILTAVQTATPSPRSVDGAKPAFKLANKTSMNLDGPGYALTLLLVGKWKEKVHFNGWLVGLTLCFRTNCHPWNGFHERTWGKLHLFQIHGLYMIKNKLTMRNLCSL